MPLYSLQTCLLRTKLPGGIFSKGPEMSEARFNIALVIFFVPYVLCDPSNILLGNLNDHRHKLEYLAVADILF
ncbi:hypothetical protein I7I48_08439 [Histoplasma ohiense]|nr:hypothetical protein I7I48_08439 [Histoplasma ohiense (nom. inval.)]